MVSYMKNHFNNIKYNIVVIEQLNDLDFNKGILFNAGYELTNKITDYYSLHDVDQLPISSNYNYKNTPHHIFLNAFEQSNSCDLLNPYAEQGYQQKGGMIIINNYYYELVNGHSNNYWGWGCIDDDFNLRLYKSTNYPLMRYAPVEKKCFYLTLDAKTNRFHTDENYKNNVKYFRMFENNKVEHTKEGLNTVKYKVKNIIQDKHYTRYQIDFNKEDYL